MAKDLYVAGDVTMSLESLKQLEMATSGVITKLESQVSGSAPETKDIPMDDENLPIDGETDVVTAVDKEPYIDGSALRQ
jgi:hypothetical protein